MFKIREVAFWNISIETSALTWEASSLEMTYFSKSEKNFNLGNIIQNFRCDESKSSQQWKFANYYPEFYKQQENVKYEK